MPTRKRKSLTRTTRTIAAVLLFGSLARIVLPSRWTAPLGNLGQWMAPVQQAAEAVVRTIVPSNEVPFRGVDSNELAALAASLEHQNAAQSVRIADLEHEVQMLTATRMWDPGGRRLGGRGRLIPAGVMGSDIVPWRSSRMLAAGTWQGVRDGAAVLSRSFTVDRGQDDGLRTGLSILLGEVLIGTIDQSLSHTSRVKLLSDISAQTKVRLGRATPKGFALVDRYFWLTGAGDGRMTIRDVEKRDVDAGLIAVGDVVLSDPQSESLPAAMTIGHIEALNADRDKPLFAWLGVRGAVSTGDLSRVYVYEPQSESP